MAVDWSYFDKFEEVTDKYLPDVGEGETKATQAVTAVCKLVYKWYNDGDVFDNTGALDGWCNNLSSYANWLLKYTDCGHILYSIRDCWNGSDYENLLKKLADAMLDEKKLDELNKEPKINSIYSCEGPFRFVEYDEDDDEY